MACRDKIRAVEKSVLSGVYEIRAQWDGEAGVWVAESDDVPGLVAEADSPKLLVQKLRTLIPELLELNGAVRDRTASFHVLYQHEDSGVLTFSWPASPPERRFFKVAHPGAEREIVGRHRIKSRPPG
jgi:predicted RNase H-like HicB family nuclease